MLIHGGFRLKGPFYWGRGRCSQASGRGDDSGRSQEARRENNKGMKCEAQGTGSITGDSGPSRRGLICTRLHDRWIGHPHTHTLKGAMCLGVSTSRPSWRVVVGWRPLLILVVGQLAGLLPNGACSLRLARILCCVVVLSHMSVLSCVGCVVGVVAFHACLSRPVCTYPVPCNALCSWQRVSGSWHGCRFLIPGAKDLSSRAPHP